MSVVRRVKAKVTTWADQHDATSEQKSVECSRTGES